MTCKLKEEKSHCKKNVLVSNRAETVGFSLADANYLLKGKAADLFGCRDVQQARKPTFLDFNWKNQKQRDWLSDLSTSRSSRRRDKIFIAPGLTPSTPTQSEIEASFSFLLRFSFTASSLWLQKMKRDPCYEVIQEPPGFFKHPKWVPLF